MQVNKNENMIQNITESATKTKFYFSDANPSYENISYCGKHSYFCDKRHTFIVEGVNSDICKTHYCFKASVPNVYFTL